MTAEALPVWLIVLIAGAATTYVWRAAGAVLVRQLRPEGQFLLWVRAVATALVAALVMRLLLLPAGILGTTALSSRLLALAVGTLVFFLARRRVSVAIAASIFALLAAEAMREAVLGG